MKDRKKVITITYSILSFLWGISFAGVVVAMFGVFFIYTQHPSVDNQLSIPVKLELNQGLIITNTNAAFDSYERITVNKQIEGNVTLKTPSLFQKTLAALRLLLTFLGLFLCVHLPRRILKSIYIGKEFDEQNISDLKLLAYIVMWLPFIITVSNYLLQYSSINTITRSLVCLKSDAFRYTNGITLDYNFLLFIAVGGIIYTFAAVFETGNNIKQENDLTV